MRLHSQTLDWGRFTPQPGDKAPVPFSYRTKKELENKIICYIGYTNPQTHDIIRKNLDASPLYSGKITGIGIRYCPSIEDKVVKFPHHRRHQFFLEPEGLETQEIYVNGLSSSLPFDVQSEILNSIPGLDQAKILRPAYGIEYDAVLPTQLRPTLETTQISNLYLAGQINGTSGYEEAAAQGLMAGINAALKVKKKKPFILGRNEAYIGVLIDDLITKGVEEPYRLFTSRAEHRIHLRIDNADKRLTRYGYELGLIPKEDYDSFLNKQKKISQTMIYLEKEKIKTPGGEKISLKDYLKKPEVRFKNMLEYGKFDNSLTDEDIRHIESEIKYEGYLKRQETEIVRIKKMDKERIPESINFQEIPGLTREVKEKLEKSRPRTIGEAKKIPGITPAAIVNLHVYLRIQCRKNVPRGTSTGHE